MSSEVFRLFEKLVWVPKHQRPKNTLFSVVFQQKVYVEVGISDFTTYLIMTNILTEEENNETKNFEAKEETLYESVFIYLNT